MGPQLASSLSMGRYLGMDPISKYGRNTWNISAPPYTWTGGRSEDGTSVHWSRRVGDTIIPWASDVPDCLAPQPLPREDNRSTTTTIASAPDEAKPIDDNDNSFKTPRGGRRGGASSCSASGAAPCIAGKASRWNERQAEGQHQATTVDTVDEGLDADGESPRRAHASGGKRVEQPHVAHRDSMPGKGEVSGLRSSTRWEEG